MSFFDSIFDSNKLSNAGQVKYDLAKLHYEKSQYEQALMVLAEAKATDPDSKKIEELNQLILEAKEEDSLNTAEGESSEDFETDTGWVVQRMETFDVESVQSYTEKGYIIEGVDYGNGEWIMVLRPAYEGESPQQYALLQDFDNESFAEYHEEEYYIVDGATDGEDWFFIMEYQEAWEGQAWTMSPSGYPKEELLDWEEQSLFINLAFEKDGVYFAAAVALSQCFEDFSSDRNKEQPNEFLAEIWEEEHWLLRVFYLKDYYFYFHGVDDSITDQGLILKEEFPEAELAEKVKEGHSIQQMNFMQGQWVILTQKKKRLDEVSDQVESEEDLTAVLDELEALVGLKKVKEEFGQLVDYLKIGRIKESFGLQQQRLSLHMVFRGNPGTGKTTVARLIGRIFKALGFLSKGHVVETDRSGLVGEYIGQTAKKTKAKLEEAMGGILFVDEAYALKSEGKSDFGEEALETILKEMEDKRESFVVIFAGYPDEMDELLESNPGLKSRFATHLSFEDFNGKELMSILKKMLIKASHHFSIEAEEAAILYLNYLADTANRYFGNAREARNLFEDLLRNQSSRLAKKVADQLNSKTDLSYDELREILLSDLRHCYSFGYEERKEETLEDILSELNQLIGLSTIKQEMVELAQYMKVLQQRNEKGLKTEMPGLHAVFMGPPGTGKTTLARLLARIYKSLGLIKQDKLIESSRVDLVAEYVGQTAVKTNKLIDKAMHGVLFIDEAYALTSRGSNDFGLEAIEVLLKRMEDERDKLVVIAAGYERPMKDFLESNPGLPSRFNKHYHFPTFKADELVEIFHFNLKKSSYDLEEGSTPFLLKLINEKLSAKDEFFGNARWIRKLFENCKISQAQRLSKLEVLNEKDLILLTVSDISSAFEKMTELVSEEGNRRPMGY